MKSEIENSKLLDAFRKGSKQLKASLIELFGPELFIPKATDRIKTFEDACVDQKLDPKKVLPYIGTKLTIEQQVINTYAMLRIIAKSLRGNWNPDWTNSNENKWYPWFQYKRASSGFVVVDTDYVCAHALTYVGSRLCFPTSELAKYFGEQFIELHRIILSN